MNKVRNIVSLACGGKMPKKRSGGSIKIKDSKKGTFTKAAKERGQGVQEFARQVLANKDNYSTAMVKKANFARNASKWNKDFGGFLQDISPLISLVPGAQPVGALAGMIGGLVQDSNTPNPFPMNRMKMGGDFKQYNAPSHEQGGQTVDINGNPNTKAPVAEIEKQENSYDGYVFSDTLINPDTGNTYAEDASKIDKKTDMGDEISKTSKILQLARLRVKNEQDRLMVESQEQESLPKAELGLPLAPLPTIGRVQYGPRPFEYPYEINEVPLLNVDVNKVGSNIGNSVALAAQTASELGGSASTPTDNIAGPVDATTDVSMQERNLNPLAATLKGASLAFGAVDALRGSEREKLQLPDYSKGDQYYQDMNIDLAPALGEITMAANKGIQDVSNQAGGIGARNSRVNSILARAGKSAAQTQLQQQQVNAQIDAQIGSREDRKAEVGAQERVRQQIAQSQNDANTRLAARKFFSDLSQVGTSLNNIQYMNDMMKNQNELGRQATKYGLAMLSQKYPNFQPDPDFITRLQNGTLTDADKPLVDQLIKFIRAEQ